MNALSVDWGSDFTVATNSFKQLKIFAGLGHKVVFGRLKELVNAAVTGKYASTRFDEPLKYAEGRNPGIEDVEECKAHT